MRYRGAFLDIDGRRIEVTVDPAAGSSGGTVEIGSGDLLWADSPVVTQHSYNDQFDTLMRESCTVSLLSRKPLTGLYGRGVMENRVTVTRGSGGSAETLFRGYVEPQVFTQPYEDLYDLVQLNCIDALSALQYCVWKDVTSAGVDYAAEKEASGQATFGSILREVFGRVLPGLPVETDGSRTIAGADILEEITVDTGIFLGEEEEDTWTLESVADAILRYLNMRACLDGDRVYLYSPDTLATGKEVAIERPTTWGTGHSIDIGETFNRLSLTAERDTVEEVVGDPLDSGSATAVYPQRALWCTEYAAYRFDDFLRIAGIWDGTKPVQYKGWRKDHYIRVMDATRWKFGGTGTRTGYSDDYYADTAVPGVNSQEEGPNKIQQGHGAMLLEVRTGQQDYDRGDNGIPSATTDSSYLVVGVGGTGEDSDAAATAFESTLRSCSPRASFTGEHTTLSPSDSSTTRYLVIGGSIRLNPVHKPKATWEGFRNWRQSGSILGQVVDQLNLLENYDTTDEDKKNSGIEGGRYYTRCHWHGDSRITTEDTGYGLFPVEDDSYFESVEYKYSAKGDDADRMLKLPVLACMLIVGDKCVVEASGSGELTSYRWQTYKERGECSSDDEYYAQSFSIGIDPKIGDKIIGPEFDITNNLHYSLGLDASGTAIPVTHEDNVGGEVRFMILGPYNMIWNDVTRRHPTWFRHTKWSEKSIPLLSHVSAIWIKDFSVKIVSDNAGEITEEGDLVYTSDTDEEYVNRKDDLTFPICSALTADERKALGVSDAVCRNMAVEAATGEGVLDITDTISGTRAKPERLYVDWHWRKASRPRVTLNHGIKDEGGNVSRWNAYTHQAMAGKTFAVDGISRDLRMGSAQVQMTEL